MKQLIKICILFLVVFGIQIPGTAQEIIIKSGKKEIKKGEKEKAYFVSLNLTSKKVKESLEHKLSILGDYQKQKGKYEIKSFYLEDSEEEWSLYSQIEKNKNHSTIWMTITNENGTYNASEILRDIALHAYVKEADRKIEKASEILHTSINESLELNKKLEDGHRKKLELSKDSTEIQVKRNKILAALDHNKIEQESLKAKYELKGNDKSRKKYDNCVSDGMKLSAKLQSNKIEEMETNNAIHKNNDDITRLTLAIKNNLKTQDKLKADLDKKVADKKKLQ